MHHPFASHPYIQELFSLGLPVDDFAIAGSGPLYVRDLIDELADVDVIARGRAWQIAVGCERPVPAPYSTVRLVQLFDKKIEILDGWFPEFWDVGDLIDHADVIDGVRFVSLDVIRRTKEILHRPKDLVHMRIIDEYLRES